MPNFTIEITKLNEDQRIAFGWASVVSNPDGLVVDTESDIIDAASLEKAVYDYVLVSREADEMHQKTSGVGRLVESMMFTPEKLEKIGVKNVEDVPLGWWVGFKVDDEEVWGKVKDGTYRMFSIFGSGHRTEEST